MIQLDLFGEVEKREQLARDRERERAEWTARFERADWIAPYDTAGGTPKGGRIPGWRCPDPDCGEIEPGPTGFLLGINHGFDPNIPGRQPFHGRCRKVWRRLGSLSPLASAPEDPGTGPRSGPKAAKEAT